MLNLGMSSSEELRRQLSQALATAVNNQQVSFHEVTMTSDQLVAETKSMCTNLFSRPECDFIRNHLLEIIAHLKRRKKQKVVETCTDSA